MSATPQDLRARLNLRDRHAQALMALRVARDELVAVQVIDGAAPSTGRAIRQADEALNAEPAGCPHPFGSLRYDGIQAGFEGLPPLAQVTCLEEGCGTSLTIPVRSDVARVHGGSRQEHGGSEVGSEVRIVPHVGG